PRRVRVAAEHDLTNGGRHFQQLRTSRMSAESRMDLHARRDFHLSIYDYGLTPEHLAVDLVDGFRRIATSRRPGTAARRSVHCADLRVRIVQRPLDPAEFFLLNIQNR